MNQVDRNTSNSSSKRDANKPAVLPTQNSPKKNQDSPSKQGDNTKSADSDMARKGSRTDAPSTSQNGSGSKSQTERQSNDHTRR